MDNHLMDEEDVMMSSDESEETETQKTKSRGSTRLPTIIRDRSNCVKHVLTYDDMGEVVGVYRAEYKSYLGVLARTMVPITYKNWFKVSLSLKAKLWSCVEAAFIVDQRSRKKVISAISTKWRTFKKHLTNKIYAFMSDPDIVRKPPAKYSHIIEQEHWNLFRDDRLSDDFQKEAKGQVYDMSVLWKMARQNKVGEYEDEEIIKQAAKIDEVTKQVQEGRLSIEGSDDILTKALGKPEHSGRVRGVGGSVTPSEYFHMPRRVNHSHCEEKVKNLETQMWQLKAEMQAQIDAIGHAARTPQSDHGSNIFKSNNTGSPQMGPVEMERTNVIATEKAPPITVKQKIIPTIKKNKVRGNNIQPPSLKPLGKKSHPCKLAMGSLDNIVAHGTTYERVGRDEKIHTIPLAEKNIRVSIDHALVKDALLPFPIIGEDTTVGGAIWFQLAWPRDLVLIESDKGHQKNHGMADNEKPSKKFRDNDEAISKDIDWANNLESINSFTSYCKQLPYQEAITIALEKEIFGHEVPIQLLREDMEYICEMKELTATCIMLYMSHLFSIRIAANKENNFLLVNPCTFSGATKTGGESKASLLATRLSESTSEQLVFFPYNVGVHWILVVIDLSSSVVYYLDSVDVKVNPSLGIIIDTAIRIYETTKGNRRRNSTWKVVKCPKQPPGVECGFYVMRYMKDLIGDQSILRKANFNGKKNIFKC